MRRTWVIASTLVALAVLVGACGGTSTGSEVRSHEPRDPVDREAIAPTVLANSSLGTDLYRALAEHNQNFAFSPYGVSVALAMAGAGAVGTTAEQLATVQHLTPDLDLDAGLNALDQMLDDRTGEQSSDVRKGRVALELPVALWGQKETRFEQPFLDTLARSFGTGMRVVDFRSDPNASRQAINSWIRDQTKGTIEELIPRGSVTDTTRLVASMAAALQAPWDIPFDASRTTSATFQLLGGGTSNVTMMGVAAPTGLLYAKSDGWQAAGMPYLGRQLEMIVLVPDAGRFADVESRFDGAELQRVIDLMRSTSLDLQLPRFAFTTQGDLDDPISEIGAPAAFTAGQADFSGITTDEALDISEFPHQAYLSVDEEGTEASATTVIPSKPPARPVTTTTLRVDRPFIVMIVDRATDEPLFLGRVVNPTD
ncbi:MAG: serpin family protein [Acidimicrobiales bacterium]